MHYLHYYNKAKEETSGGENVRKDLLAILITAILVSMIFCGCQGTQVEKNDYDDIFESDIVTLTNYSMELDENKFGVTAKAVVSGRIENTLDRMVNVVITAKFFDNNDDFLGEKTLTIKGLKSKGNPSSSTTTTFTITYEEENVAQIDHLKLQAVEKID